ncbi:MAG: M48 family metalloprotease [Ekhidna sp.]
MRLVKVFIISGLLASIAGISSCDKNGDFLLFSVQDDLALGKQVADEIAANPDQFPILSRTQYADAYAILDDMLEDILATEDVTYKSEFAWELHIIDDDQTLNAFATPGGYLYVYTGLIYFLDHLDDLAGVMGHEVAHSDQRHSSKQLQRQYGISILLSIISGQDAGSLQQIVGQLSGTLAGLAFSRSAEAEADDFSVRYLAETKYACNGAAAFFEKLLENQTQRNPEFLSTHPSPDSRVEDINTTATELGCDTSLNDGDRADIRRLQSLLP